MTSEPIELMDPHHILEDHRGLAVFFINLSRVLSGVGCAFKDKESCKDFSLVKIVVHLLY